MPPILGFHGRRPTAIARALSFAVALVGLAASGPAAAEESSVVWRPEWPKFGWAEGAATGGLIAASYLEDRYLTGPASPHWTGAVLVDNQVRGLLRGRSLHVQQVATRYADVGYTTLTIFPYFDVAIALGVHRSPEVALQMALIDAQALSFTSSLTNITKWLVGRQRPYARDCIAGETVGVHACGTSYDNIGFFSGHTSATFTGAALTCVHHEHLPLYGGGAPDVWACIWALTGASATAVLRLVSDDHYASDVMVGAAAGLLSGYVLPSLLHYGFGRERTKARSGTAHEVVPVLLPLPAGIGVGVAGGL